MDRRDRELRGHPNLRGRDRALPPAGVGSASVLGAAAFAAHPKDNFLVATDGDPPQIPAVARATACRLPLMYTNESTAARIEISRQVSLERRVAFIRRVAHWSAGGRLPRYSRSAGFNNTSRGTCTNSRTPKRHELECVYVALKEKLLNPRGARPVVPVVH